MAIGSVDNKEVDAPSLTQFVGSNAAVFAHQMRDLVIMDKEIVAPAVAAFVTEFTAYWIRKVENGEASFMDTDTL